MSEPSASADAGAGAEALLGLASSQVRLPSLSALSSDGKPSPQPLQPPPTQRTFLPTTAPGVPEAAHHSIPPLAPPSATLLPPHPQHRLPTLSEWADPPFAAALPRPILNPLPTDSRDRWPPSNSMHPPFTLPQSPWAPSQPLPFTYQTHAHAPPPPLYYYNNQPLPERALPAPYNLHSPSHPTTIPSVSLPPPLHVSHPDPPSAPSSVHPLATLPAIDTLRPVAVPNPTPTSANLPSLTRPSPSPSPTPPPVSLTIPSSTSASASTPTTVSSAPTSSVPKSSAPSSERLLLPLAVPTPKPPSKYRARGLAHLINPTDSPPRNDHPTPVVTVAPVAHITPVASVASTTTSLVRVANVAPVITVSSVPPVSSIISAQPVAHVPTAVPVSSVSSVDPHTVTLPPASHPVHNPSTPRRQPVAVHPVTSAPPPPTTAEEPIPSQPSRIVHPVQGISPVTESPTPPLLDTGQPSPSSNSTMPQRPNKRSSKSTSAKSPQLSKVKTAADRHADTSRSPKPLSRSRTPPISLPQDRLHQAEDDNADQEVTRCPCGSSASSGFMIACDQCNTWQHSKCMGFRRRSEVPDVYFCNICRPNEMRVTCVAHPKYKEHMARERHVRDAIREFDNVLADVKPMELRKILAMDLRNKKAILKAGRSEAIVKYAGLLRNQFSKHRQAVTDCLVLLLDLPRAEAVERLETALKRIRQVAMEKAASDEAERKRTVNASTADLILSGGNLETPSASTDIITPRSVGGSRSGATAKRPRPQSLQDISEAITPRSTDGTPHIADPNADVDPGGGSGGRGMTREERKLRQTIKLIARMEEREREKKKPRLDVGHSPRIPMSGRPKTPRSGSGLHIQTDDSAKVKRGDSEDGICSDIGEPPQLAEPPLPKKGHFSEAFHDTKPAVDTSKRERDAYRRERGDRAPKRKDSAYQEPGVGGNSSRRRSMLERERTHDSKRRRTSVKDAEARGREAARRGAAVENAIYVPGPSVLGSSLIPLSRLSSIEREHMSIDSSVSTLPPLRLIRKDLEIRRSMLAKIKEDLKAPDPVKKRYRFQSVLSSMSDDGDKTTTIPGVISAKKGSSSMSEGDSEIQVPLNEVALDGGSLHPPPSNEVSLVNMGYTARAFTPKKRAFMFEERKVEQREASVATLPTAAALHTTKAMVTLKKGTMPKDEPVAKEEQRPSEFNTPTKTVSRKVFSPTVSARKDTRVPLEGPRNTSSPALSTPVAQSAGQQSDSVSRLRSPRSPVAAVVTCKDPPSSLQEVPEDIVATSILNKDEAILAGIGKVKPRKCIMDVESKVPFSLPASDSGIRNCRAESTSNAPVTTSPKVTPSASPKTSSKASTVYISEQSPRALKASPKEFPKCSPKSSTKPSSKTLPRLSSKPSPKPSPKFSKTSPKLSAMPSPKSSPKPSSKAPSKMSGLSSPKTPRIVGIADFGASKCLVEKPNHEQNERRESIQVKTVLKDLPTASDRGSGNGVSSMGSFKPADIVLPSLSLLKSKYSPRYRPGLSGKPSGPRASTASNLNADDDGGSTSRRNGRTDDTTKYNGDVSTPRNVLQTKISTELAEPGVSWLGLLSKPAPIDINGQAEAPTKAASRVGSPTTPSAKGEHLTPRKLSLKSAPVPSSSCGDGKRAVPMSKPAVVSKPSPVSRSGPDRELKPNVGSDVNQGRVGNVLSLAIPAGKPIAANGNGVASYTTNGSQSSTPRTPKTPTEVRGFGRSPVQNDVVSSGKKTVEVSVASSSDGIAPRSAAGMTANGMMSGKLGLTSKPVTTGRLGLTSKPVGASKPGLISKPMPMSKPVMMSRPALSSKPILTTRPSSGKPGLTSKPVDITGNGRTGNAMAASKGLGVRAMGSSDELRVGRSGIGINGDNGRGAVAKPFGERERGAGSYGLGLRSVRSAPPREIGSINGDGIGRQEGLNGAGAEPASAMSLLHQRLEGFLKPGAAGGVSMENKRAGRVMGPGSSHGGRGMGEKMRGSNGLGRGGMMGNVYVRNGSGPGFGKVPPGKRGHPPGHGGRGGGPGRGLGREDDKGWGNGPGYRGGYMGGGHDGHGNRRKRHAP